MTDAPAEPPEDRLKRFPVPEGVSPAAFRNVLLAAGTAYRRLGRVPSAKDIYDVWPRVPQATIGQILLSDEFADAAQVLGLPVDDLGGLTREQHVAIAVLADPFDRRGIQAKLKSVGIPMGRYLNWKKNPVFAGHLEHQSFGAYQEALPEIRARLIEKAEAGDQRAIEMVFAISKEWDPRGQQVENAQILVTKVMEAVMRHVQDLDTRRAILEDIRAYGTTLSIGAPPA